MEAFETFNKLSDDEKVKFFQTLCGNTNGDISLIGDGSSHSKSSEKPSLNSLLAHFISTSKPASGESSVNSNCGLGDQKKKQKTLDSWVIKSPSKKNAEATPSPKNQSVDRTLETTVNASPVNSSVSRPLTIDNEIPSSSKSVSTDNQCTTKRSKYSSVESGKCNENQNVLTSNCNSIPSHTDPKNYTLRSKRKRNSLSPVTGDERPTKYLKSKSDNDASKQSNSLNKPNNDSIQSLSTEDSRAPHCALSKDAEKAIEDNSNPNVSLGNRTASKINVKKKNSKPQSSVKDTALVSSVASDSVTTVGSNALTNNEAASKLKGKTSGDKRKLTDGDSATTVGSNALTNNAAASKSKGKASGDKRKLTDVDNLDVPNNIISPKLKAKNKVSELQSPPDSVLGDISEPTSTNNSKASKLKQKVSKSQALIPSDSSDTNSGSNKKTQNLLTTSSHPNTILSQANYVAFYKLHTECSRIGLKIADILKNEKIQDVLESSKDSDAMVFLESVESTSGEKLPVVHVLDSKSRLFDMLTFDLNNSDLK